MKGKREELIVWEIERENIRREGRGREVKNTQGKIKSGRKGGQREEVIIW